MDILYRARWKDKYRVTIDAPETSGIGRVALAACAIALAVGILETASTDHSETAAVAWNVAEQGSAQ